MLVLAHRVPRLVAWRYGHTSLAAAWHRKRPKLLTLVLFFVARRGLASSQGCLEEALGVCRTCRTVSRRRSSSLL